MTGAEIIGSLLREEDGSPQLVPPSSIRGGRLPDNIQLPALLVKVTSTIERQPLKRGATTRTIDRVSVTVRARDYEQRRDIMTWLRTRCAGRTGNVAGGVNVSILTAGAGPELDGPGDSFERTQDFSVGHDA